MKIKSIIVTSLMSVAVYVGFAQYCDYYTAPELCAYFNPNDAYAGICPDCLPGDWYDWTGEIDSIDCEQVEDNAQPYFWCEGVWDAGHTVKEYDFEDGTKNCPTTCGTAEVKHTYNFYCYGEKVWLCYQ